MNTYTGSQNKNKHKQPPHSSLPTSMQELLNVKKGKNLMNQTWECGVRVARQEEQWRGSTPADSVPLTGSWAHKHQNHLQNFNNWTPRPHFKRNEPELMKGLEAALTNSQVSLINPGLGRLGTPAPRRLIYHLATKQQ